MKNSEEKEYLAKWLSGELSPEELERLAEHEPLSDIQRTIESVDNLPLPRYSAIDEWEKLSPRLKTNTQTNSARRIWLMGAIAAGLAILIGLFLWLNQPTTIASSNAVMTSLFPDNSSVILSPNSKIEFKKRGWHKSRRLVLQGMAEFDVTKGASFVVSTDFGEIEVLGTKFVIDAINDIPYIKCFEGSVKVSTASQESIVLKEGEGVKIESQKLQPINTYLNGSSKLMPSSNYKNITLDHVANILEEVYDLKVEIPETNNNSYSGPILYNNINDALKLITEPLNLNFEIDSSEQIRIYK